MVRESRGKGKEESLAPNLRRLATLLQIQMHSDVDIQCSSITDNQSLKRSKVVCFGPMLMLTNVQILQKRFVAYTHTVV